MQKSVTSPPPSPQSKKGRFIPNKAGAVVTAIAVAGGVALIYIVTIAKLSGTLS